jgi:hypothetical protein
MFSGYRSKKARLNIHPRPAYIEVETKTVLRITSSNPYTKIEYTETNWVLAAANTSWQLNQINIKIHQLHKLF